MLSLGGSDFYIWNKTSEQTILVFYLVNWNLLGEWLEFFYSYFKQPHSSPEERRPAKTTSMSGAAEELLHPTISSWQQAQRWNCVHVHLFSQRMPSSTAAMEHNFYYICWQKISKLILVFRKLWRRNKNSFVRKNLIHFYQKYNIIELFNDLCHCNMIL